MRQGCLTWDRAQVEGRQEEARLSYVGQSSGGGIEVSWEVGTLQVWGFKPALVWLWGGRRA